MRKPQKRNCIKINSHSPREAEPDTRTLPAAPTHRSTLQPQHALPSEDTTVILLHLLFLFLKALFKDYWQHLGLQPSVQRLSPASSAHPIVHTHNRSYSSHMLAASDGSSIPLLNFSTSLFSSSSLCRCSRNFREHRRASMLKSRWVLASICSLLPHRHAALI